MARVTRTLRVAAILAAVLLWPAPASAANNFHAPVALDGKVFPVLNSAEGRWLNWRDTYGALRMRQQPDGVWKQTGTHQGIDIFTERGAPIVAITSGTIERSGWTFYSGWRIGVRGNDNRYYFYAHLLQEFAPGIAEGAVVTAGQLLGRVGSSGYGPVGTADEFPPHLHLGIQAGTRWVNPEPLLRQLFLHSTTSIRNHRGRVAAIDFQIRALGARAHLPAAPAAADLAARIAALVNQRRELLRQTTLAI